VTGSGTTADPWTINILDAETNVEGRFFRIFSSDETIAVARVARSMVQRIDPAVVSGLTSGIPDLEVMFEQPANTVQIFNRIEGRTGTFNLTYNGSTTSDLTQSSNAVEIEAALNALPGLTVEVTGAGTSRDPWRVNILAGDKDSKGNYFLLSVNNPDLITAPMDQADAAATTRPSASLGALTDYQRVYYDSPPRTWRSTAAWATTPYRR